MARRISRWSISRRCGRYRTCLYIRPADANETAQAWKFILQYHGGPVALLLTRQNLPVIDQTKYAPADNLAKGAYVLISADKPDVLLLATGSEVSLAMEAYNKLSAEGIKARVVSMPCWELFEKQSKEYRDSVILPDVKARVGVEAAIELGWHKWIGDKGTFIGMSLIRRISPIQDLLREIRHNNRRGRRSGEKTVG